MTPVTLPTVLAFLGNIGPWQIAIILVIGLIIFGKRLPEVGKSLGKGIVEFKKGLSGVQKEMHALENEVDEAVEQPAQLTKEVDAA